MYNSASAVNPTTGQAQPQPTNGGPSSAQAAAGYHHEFLEAAAAMCFCHRFLNPFGGSLGLSPNG